MWLAGQKRVLLFFFLFSSKRRNKKKQKKSVVCCCLLHIKLNPLPSGACHKALEANLEIFSQLFSQLIAVDGGLLSWTPCEQLDQSCHVSRGALVFTPPLCGLSRSHGCGSRLAFCYSPPRYSLIWMSMNVWINRYEPVTFIKFFQSLYVVSHSVNLSWVIARENSTRVLSSNQEFSLEV